MNKTNKFLIIGILLVLTLQNVVALGVSPGRNTLNYPDEVSKTFSFNVLNSENKHFKVDIHYKIMIPQVGTESNSSPQVDGKPNKGGRPKEQILMTVNTFKKLCMKSNTDKANEIHDYYVNLERVLHETVTEESESLLHQLEHKEKELEHKEKELEDKDKEIEDKEKERKRIKYLYDRVVGSKKRKLYKRDNCVYIGINPMEKKYFKVGSTSDPNKREGTLSSGTLTDFEMKRIWYSEYYKEIEKITHIRFNESRILNRKEFFCIDKFEEVCEFVSNLVNFLTLENDVETNGKVETRESNKISRNSLLLSEKPCKVCKEIKSLDNFFDAKEHVDGKENTCKPCVKERQRKYVEEKRKTTEIPKEKVCTSCKEMLSLDKYYKDKVKFDGVGTKCKNCFLKAREESVKEKVLIKEYKCKKCDTVKPIDNFGNNRKSKTGYKYTCKECLRKIGKERYHKKIKENIENDVDITEDVKYKYKAEMARQRNKEKLKNKMICECGVETNELGYSRHKNTKLHKSNMSKLQNLNKV